MIIGSLLHKPLLLAMCVAGGLAAGFDLLPKESVSLYSYTVDPAFHEKLGRLRIDGKAGNWEPLKIFLNDETLQNNPQAKYELAQLYIKGLGGEKNAQKARNLLLQAIQYHFPERASAAHEIGELFLASNGKDCFRIAFEWFVKAASWGHLDSYTDIAKAYDKGLGVQADYDEAIKYYTLAIENGSSSSVVALLDLALKQQRDGNANPERGMLLLQKYTPALEVEAEKGDSVAARTLGRIYERGIFVEHNIDVAIKWYALAASFGDPAAMHDLALLGMTKEKDPLDTKQSIAILKDSASLGYSASMTALGRLYLEDTKFRNTSLAHSYFEKGVKAGHEGSMEELAVMLLEGRAIPRDLKRAKELAERGTMRKHKGSEKVLLRILQLEEASKSNNVSFFNQASK